MKNNVIGLSSLLLGIILLFVILPYFGNSIFSSLKDICSIPTHELEKIREGMAYTFYRFIVSILIGYIVGIILSIPCLLSGKLEAVLTPWYTVVRITPTIVWIPLLFNLPNEVLQRETIPIILGVLFSSLYVSMHIIKVLKNIPDEEKIAMKTMNVNFQWKWNNCYFPRILVSSVSSLKIGGSIAFILVIVGESLVSVEKSLGFLLTSYQTVMLIAKPQFWLTTIIISFLAIIIFSMCNLLNKLTRTNE